MTLPQHLEPFTMEDNPSVLIALKHGRLPYTDETGIFNGSYYICRICHNVNSIGNSVFTIPTVLKLKDFHFKLFGLGL